jgi:hypothetical protein
MAGKVMLATALIMLAGCDGHDNTAKSAGGVTRLDGAGPLPDGAAPTFSDRIDVAEGRGIFIANRGGKLTRIPFNLDFTRVDPARGHMVAPVGATEAGVVVMIDDYATKASANAPRCEEGTETFVRVFSLPLARELASVPAGSCLDGVPRPTSEATWLPPDGFRVETSPTRTFAINGVDRISVVGRNDVAKTGSARSR